VHRRHPQAFVVPWSFVACCLLSHLSSLLSYGPSAPTIHPTSSCSLAWGWVLCRSSSMLLLFIIVIPVVVIHHCPTSSLSSLFIVIVPIIVPIVIVHCCLSVCPHCLSPLSIHPCCSSSTHRLFVIVCCPSPHPTCGPPHEQLLMRLGVGGASSSMVHCPLSSSPVIGWSLVVPHCLSFVVSPSFVVFIVQPWCTCHPPDKQLLVSVGVGASINHHCCHCHPCLSPLSSPVIPHLASPHCFLLVHCCSLMEDESLPSPIVPPTFHPTGSGLWGWGQVVHYWVL
jgi:hypothetical protein